MREQTTPVGQCGGGGVVTWTTMDTDFPSTLTVDDPITSITLDATGTGAITYSYTGALPVGLTLAGGIVSGTPTMESASTTVTFTATDDDGNDENLVVSFPPISASSGGSVTWYTTSADFPSTLTVDDPISSVILDATGSGAITYDYTGSLPMGLTLAGGIVSGTPTISNATSTTVTFRATDTASNTEDLIVTFPQVDASGGGVTWNTTSAEFSSLTLTEGTPMSPITLSASGTGTISYADDAMLPAGISLVAGVVSGTPSTSTAIETTVTFTAQDDNGDTETLTVSFPIISAGGGTETVAFDTPAGTLATFDAGDNVNETVDATASQGSSITYTFTATNSANAFGLTGTGISVTGNNISGIAPRLYVAATFTFDFTAEIGNGATNSRTFEIDILEDSTCVSPTDNICT